MNIAIVTGASSGMGREFVLQLPKYVYVDEIWAIARREDALKSLQEESSVPIRPICLDLCKTESFFQLASLLQEHMPYVDLLVNAAGFGRFGDFDNIPLDDDLQMIDLNCKALVGITRIVLPLIKPTIISLTIYTFISAWNDFLWPLIIVTDEAHTTLTLGLSTLTTVNATNYGLLMAGSTLTFVIPFLLYIFLQKQFQEGIARSGVKG